jgi:hypothetical protein
MFVASDGFADVLREQLALGSLSQSGPAIIRLAE